MGMQLRGRRAVRALAPLWAAHEDTTTRLPWVSLVALCVVDASVCGNTAGINFLPRPHSQRWANQPPLEFIKITMKWMIIFIRDLPFSVA
jgi:hypothetical protein